MNKCKTIDQKDERIMKEKILWEKLAANYDKQISTYENAYKLSIEKSKKVLKSSHKVLEIACGTGIISFGIADQVESVIAIDISSNMISIAKEKSVKLGIKNVDFQTADGYFLQFEENSFDTILLFNSLHIVKEPNSLLSEAFRVLKPKGFLVTATDCYLEPVSFLIKIKLLITKLMKQFGIISYLSFYKKKDIITLLAANNFEIIEDDILHAEPVNYYVLGQKKF